MLLDNELCCLFFLAVFNHSRYVSDEIPPQLQLSSEVHAKYGALKIGLSSQFNPGFDGRATALA